MFLPDAETARTLNSKLADDLIASLASIVDLVERHGGGLPPDIASTVEAKLRLPALDSLIYARHYEAMLAARDERWDDCRSILDTLRSDDAAAPRFHCVRWGGDLPEAKRDAFLRCVNSDPRARIVFEEVSPADFAQLEDLTAQALALLVQAAPEVVGELTELVRELVFANCDRGAGFTFDGITSFYCWGALFLNAAEHDDLIELVDGLSHEGAHSYLFGLATGAPYLTNGLGARFSSPLRADPRPLEGIYHATFVSARMHYAQSRLLSSGLLSPEHVDAADMACHRARQAFYAGLQTLDAHADYTPLGRALMDDTLAYMRSEDA